MILRSMLFVPGDSERKLAKSLGVPADAIIIDLEDAVTPTRKAQARETTREFLHQLPPADTHRYWVRVNPLGSGLAGTDLRALRAERFRGVVLPKAESAADVENLGEMLETLERDQGLETGAIAVLPIVTETPGALFQLDSYRRMTHGRGSARLAGLGWGAEDLQAAVGATRNRDSRGRWTPPYQLAKALCLFAARAAGIEPIDSIYTDYRDADGLAAFADDSRADGFGGMLAIHPAQVPIINAAFTPSAEEARYAQRVVDAFAQQPDAGAIGLEGRMLDAPHLAQARRLLEIAARVGTHDD